MAEKTGKDMGLREIVLDEIGRLAEKYNVEKVILFGSRARGNFQRASDIDLAVLGGDILNFSLDVDETTQTLLEFDFVDLSKPIQKELAEAIQREGTVLYEKV